MREIERQGANALPVFAYSLKEDAARRVPIGLSYFAGGVDAVISTMSFAMGRVNADGPTPSGWSVEALEQLGVPVLQAITVGSSYAQWDASQRGLSPVETAMNVAIPEFDGRIITVPISFKEEPTGSAWSRDGLRSATAIASRAWWAWRCGLPRCGASRTPQSASR